MVPVSRVSNADYLDCEPDEDDTDWNDNDDNCRHDDNADDDDGADAGDSDGDNNDEQAAGSSKIYSVHNCILFGVLHVAFIAINDY